MPKTDFFWVDHFYLWSYANIPKMRFLLRGIYALEMIRKGQLILILSSCHDGGSILRNSPTTVALPSDLIRVTPHIANLFEPTFQTYQHLRRYSMDGYRGLTDSWIRLFSLLKIPLLRFDGSVHGVVPPPRNNEDVIFLFTTARQIKLEVGGFIWEGFGLVPVTLNQTWRLI